MKNVLNDIFMYVCLYVHVCMHRSMYVDRQELRYMYGP